MITGPETNRTWHVLIVLILLSLCACGSGSSPSTTTSTLTFETTTETPTTSATTPYTTPYTTTSTVTTPPTTILVNPCQDPLFPIHLRMAGPDGITTPDLKMCTNKAEDTAVIDNSSGSVVWSISGRTPYWSPSDDTDAPAPVRVFRAGMRIRYAAAGEVPYKTIEPGIRATIGESPTQIHLYASKEVEGAYQVALLAVQTAQRVVERVKDYTKEQAEEAVEELVSGGSKDRQAMVTCAVNGFMAGQTLSSTEPEPSQELLVDLHETYNDVDGCFKSIQEAQHEDAAAGEVPEITVTELEDAGKAPEWVEPTDSILKKVVGGVLDLVITHE